MEIHLIDSVIFKNLRINSGMVIACQIFEYLPLKYKNPSDTDYFSFPAHSVEQNCKAKNYHFSVVSLHMIYMGIVYHDIYGIFPASCNEVY